MMINHTRNQAYINLSKELLIRRNRPLSVGMISILIYDYYEEDEEIHESLISFYFLSHITGIIEMTHQKFVSNDQFYYTISSIWGISSIFLIITLCK